MRLGRVLKFEASIWKTIELKKSKLFIVKNVPSMLKILYAGCPGLSPAVLPQFTLKICVSPKLRKIQ